MKKYTFTLLTFSLCLLFVTQKSYGQSQATERYFYQIKIYSFDSKEQEKQTDQFLKTAYLPALHRADIDQVGVFKPVEKDTTASPKIYVIIPLPSLEKLDELSNTLQNDSQFRSNGQDFLGAAHDQPPYSRIQSILLKSFKNAPKPKASGLTNPKTDRIYELRSYESATGALNKNKVEMFNKGSEIDIFDRLNFNPIFYGNVLIGDSLPNLMYMISFKNMESRDNHWDEFGSDPRWKKLSAMEKYQNNLSNIENHLLRATPYSDI